MKAKLHAFLKRRKFWIAGGVATFLFLCCSLTLLAAASSPQPVPQHVPVPSPTVRMKVIAPTSTKAMKVVPTRAPVPTKTLAVKSDEVLYRRWVVDNSLTCMAAFTLIKEQNSKAADNPYIIKTEAWTNDTIVALKSVQKCANAFLEPHTTPAKFAGVDLLLQLGSAEILSFVKDYANGVDNLDADLLAQGLAHLNNANEYLSQATAMLKDL